MILTGIGEVSDALGVEQHVVRFWTRAFPQLRPTQRARRWYYRAEDLELLHGIRALLHDRGLTLDGLRRVFRERGPAFVRAVGRCEAAGDSLDGLAASLALADLPVDWRAALIETLGDPVACRALAERCVAARRMGTAHG